MRRLPLAAFGALVVATVAAFFITQHLKVTTPLIAGQTYGMTPHNIVPTSRSCPAVTTYFHVLHHADSVNVYIVDRSGRIVRTLARNVPGAIKQNLQFTWDGRLPNGAPAPAGLYNFRVTLVHQRRTIDPLIPNFPIEVQTTCPPP